MSDKMSHNHNNDEIKAYPKDPLPTYDKHTPIDVFDNKIQDQHHSGAHGPPSPPPKIYEYDENNQPKQIQPDHQDPGHYHYPTLPEEEHQQQQRSSIFSRNAANRRLRRSLAKTNTTTSDVLLYILAVFLPPVAVLLKTGCDAHFVLNVILTLICCIPGVLHAWWVIARHDKRQQRRRDRAAGYGNGYGNGQSQYQDGEKVRIRVD